MRKWLVFTLVLLFLASVGTSVVENSKDELVQAPACWEEYFVDGSSAFFQFRGKEGNFQLVVQLRDFDPGQIITVVLHFNEYDENGDEIWYVVGTVKCNPSGNGSLTIKLEEAFTSIIIGNEDGIPLFENWY